MAFMDVRQAVAFDVHRQWETMDRDSRKIVDYNALSAGTSPVEVIEGEPVREISDTTVSYIANTYVFNINDAGDHVVGMMMPGANNAVESVAGISFDHFTEPLTGTGSPSANIIKKISVLKGEFEAKFKNDNSFFNAGTGGLDGAFVAPRPGCDVVVLNNTTERPTRPWEFACVVKDATHRYPGGSLVPATDAGRNQFDRCVVGKVTAVDANYVYVKFSI